MIFTVCAIGEICVGIIVLAFPAFLSLLLDARLDAHGLLVARLLGVGILALGLTWWNARKDATRLHVYGSGFLAYNLGVGALFAVAAIAAKRPVLPWLVVLFHLLAAAVLLGVILMQRGGRQDIRTMKEDITSGFRA